MIKSAFFWREVVVGGGGVGREREDALWGN